MMFKDIFDAMKTIYIFWRLFLEKDFFETSFFCSLLSTL